MTHLHNGIKNRVDAEKKGSVNLKTNQLNLSEIKWSTFIWNKNKMKRKKKSWKNWIEHLRTITCYKCSDTQVVMVPERDEREYRNKILEEIMANNFTKFIKEINPQI